MGGKAKPTKHTAKELAKKAADAKTNKGGGKAGQEDRAGGKAGHGGKFVCHVCGQLAMHLKTLEDHISSKHPKETWDPTRYEDQHALHGGTTQGVGVRGGYSKEQHHN